MKTRLLIVTFYEIAIKYKSGLKIQFVLLNISMNHNVGPPRSLHLKFCQVIYLFKTFIMLWRIFINAVGYLVMIFQKISAKLVISLKHNIIFAKFLEIPLDDNVTSSHTHIHWQRKNHFEIIWVSIFRLFIKGTISPKFF